MPSNYPGALDAFTNPTSGVHQDVVPHAQQHIDINDSMEAVQAELGLNPANGFVDVAAAIAALLAPERRRVYLASEFIPQIASGPEINGAEVSNNDIGIDVLAFDPTVAEYAYITLDWPAGCTTATVAFEWTTVTGGSGSVRAQASMRCYADGDAIDQAQGTPQAVTDAWQANLDWHISAPTPAITPAGTVAAGAPCVLLISRQPTHADDTMTGADWSLIRVIVEFSP